MDPKKIDEALAKSCRAWILGVGIVFLIIITFLTLTHLAARADDNDTWYDFVEGEIIDQDEVNPMFDHITEHVVPRHLTGARVNETYDLGTNSHKWRTAHIKHIELSGNITGETFSMMFQLPGAAAIGTKLDSVYIPRAFTIEEIMAYADTAPVGSAITIDVNLNGTTIFTDQDDRISIEASSNSDTTVPAVTAMTKGQRLTWDIDLIGSSTPGGDFLMLTISGVTN